MKRIQWVMVSLVIALAAQAGPETGTGVTGEWLGALEVGPTKLRLGLHIEQNSDGGLLAILDSIDQGAKIPVETIVFEGGTLRLGIKAIGGSYEGNLSPDGNNLEGVWSQGGQKLPLRFERREEAFVLHRPQLPKAPFPYRRSEVTFVGAGGNVRLAGTLLVPDGAGPFPAVALVTGSGAQDRDESLMGHQPFLVIADALARRGIASLRWDDRGVGGSQGDSLAATVDDLAADARAAVAFLRGRPEVKVSAVGIIGHSEGGLIGPQAAAADDSVAFLVLLAPPGEPLRSLLLRQTRDLYRLRGLDPALIERALAAQVADLDRIADSGVPTDRLRETLRAQAEVRRKEFTAEERARLQIDAETVERSIQVATTPWFRSLVRQEPAASLRAIRIAVLALFGEKDVQVAAEVNAAAVRAALAAGKNPETEVRILPGLNHLFQHAGSGGLEEYGTIEETFSPEALGLIGDWIAARFPAPKR